MGKYRKFLLTILFHFVSFLYSRPRRRPRHRRPPPLSLSLSLPYVTERLKFGTWQQH